MLEAFARSVALSVVDVENVPEPSVDRDALTALYYDSYCAAVWTSAHAEFLATVQDLLGNRVATEQLVRDFMVPPPDLYSVTNLSSLLHIGGLNERSASPRCCSKSSHALLAILTRATNAGSRGWEATLLSALNESEGAVRVCMQAIAVALSGLNPAVHPAARQPWRERFALPSRAAHANAPRLPGDREERPRRGEGVHPAAPGRGLFRGLRNAAKPCATRGSQRDSCASRRWRCRTRRSQRPCTAWPPRAPTWSPRARGGRGAISAPGERAALAQEGRDAHGNADCRSAEALAYSSSWLGRPLGRAGAAARPAVHVVSGLLSASYRSIWIPFWLHGNHHGHRASRLDSAQYAALHHLSRGAPHVRAASRGGVPEGRAPRDQQRGRVAAHGGAGVQPPRDRAADAESAPRAAVSPASRAVQEAEVEVMHLGANDAALLIAFARIAALQRPCCRTTWARPRGASRRWPSASACCCRSRPTRTRAWPCARACRKHATVLYCCSECRRVVNSVQDGSGKDHAFNELGLAASMLSAGDNGCSRHMRCAKRSSAALRTAVALEASAEQLEARAARAGRRARCCRRTCGPRRSWRPCARRGPSASPRAAMSAASAALRDSSSEVAKFRRDLKSCFEQSPQATSCGDVPLVCVPVLGRAIRIFGGWYALCSMCGTLARVTPASRFRGEICCLRCDFAMLAGKAAAEEMRSALPKPPSPMCRYCGKAEPENGSGMKWRRVESPMDTGGRNACVPAPAAHRSLLPVALPVLAGCRAPDHVDHGDHLAPGEQGAARVRRQRRGEQGQRRRRKGKHGRVQALACALQEQDGTGKGHRQISQAAQALVSGRFPFKRVLVVLTKTGGRKRTTVQTTLTALQTHAAARSAAASLRGPGARLARWAFWSVR